MNTVMIKNPAFMACDMGDLHDQVAEAGHVVDGVYPNHTTTRELRAANALLEKYGPAEDFPQCAGSGEWNSTYYIAAREIVGWTDDADALLEGAAEYTDANAYTWALYIAIVENSDSTPCEHLYGDVQSIVNDLDIWQ